MQKRLSSELLTSPYMRLSSGQPNLLYIVEQSGRSKFSGTKYVLVVPSLTLAISSALVMKAGLLSVAFPPDYEASRRFYVAFTNASGELEVDEFMRSATNPTRAIRNSRRIVLTVPHPGSANHNGGQLQFGPRDGLLYISTGDGGLFRPLVSQRVILRISEAKSCASSRCRLERRPILFPDPTPLWTGQGATKCTPMDYVIHGVSLSMAQPYHRRCRRGEAGGSEFLAHGMSLA